MSKRPSVVSVFDADEDTPAPELKVVKDVKSTPKTASDVQKTSTYIPLAVHDVLREIAFHERSKVHDLVMEGIDLVLKSRRHPSIAELKSRKAL